MIPGQPMPGRMMPSVSANIHPASGGPPPPGMSPMSGNLIGPRVPLAAPNGMCKWDLQQKTFLNIPGVAFLSLALLLEKSLSLKPLYLLQE